jgi:hypothetical protein
MGCGDNPKGDVQPQIAHPTRRDLPGPHQTPDLLQRARRPEGLPLSVRVHRIAS